MMAMVDAVLWSRELRIRRRSRVVVTGARERGDLLADGEGEVKDKAYIACRCTMKNWLSRRKGKRRIMNFG